MSTKPANSVVLVDQGKMDDMKVTKAAVIEDVPPEVGEPKIAKTHAEMSLAQMISYHTGRINKMQERIVELQSKIREVKKLRSALEAAQKLSQ